ncbi:ATP-binding cassette domain-containing protein [Kordiimonas sp.]|uniref:ATP-binding cassette domain-containing protein n=1 Tax=Kordiimonas sp. TaxID=1970157 RepID=UPI003A8FFEA9
MITAENVTKVYATKVSRRVLIRDLSFHFPGGGDFAILGAGGSGLSSLLNMIGGLSHPTRGTIRRQGTTSWPFGQMHYEKMMSAHQNIRFLCRVLGERDFDAVENRVRELTGFDQQLRRPSGTLRQDEKRAIGFALSLCFSFDIMLLDGMPTFFTFETRKKMKDAFLEKREQSTVVLATKNPAEIKNSFSHVLVLHNGTGRLYDDRQDAIEAFKEINANAPEKAEKAE